MADDEKIAHLRRKHGDFYNPEIDEGDRREDSRLRELIERLRDEDNRQNHRLREIEDAIDVMKADISGIWKSYTRLETALIGHNGQNGIRGTMMEHYRTTNDRLDKMDASITSISGSLQTLAAELSTLVVTLKTITRVAAAIAGIAGFVAVVIGIARSLPLQ